MNMNKDPSKHTPLLWWMAIFALVISGALYYFLGKKAEFDVDTRQLRMVFPLIGIVIAGICLIIGTSGRWFYPK